MQVIRLATRGSALALAQTEYVAGLLRQHLPAVRCEIVTALTRGDRQRDTPLAEFQTPDGIFTRGVEAEVLAGRAEAAVHSLKDLPTAEDPSLALVAFPRRGEARDALVSREPRGLAGLPSGATIGTSSPRRQAQVRASRPDLRTIPVRGNVDTRLRKLASGECEALILAVAGLERLGLADRITQLLPPDQFTPAAGQGALAIQCRIDDAATARLLRELDHAETRAAVLAERVFTRAVGGGCRIPLGAYGEVRGNRLTLTGFLSAPDGAGAIWDRLDGTVGEPETLGQLLADRFLSRVSRTLLAAARGE